MIVTNGWYLGAWADEVDRTFTKRWITGQPVLFFRLSDGTPVALNDRCPHRRYPLSLGRLDGDVVECGYHGYRFDGASGACVGVREQADQPKAQVHRYPLVERYGALWIWTGDADAADESLLPDLSWVVDDDWTVVKGMLPLKARHLLLVENLLDLSHETFLHPTTIGNAAVAATPIDVTADADRDVVYFTRRMVGIDAPPFYQKSCGLTSPVDRWQDGEFHAPGIFVLNIRLAPTGTEEPEGFHMKVIYGMTPETENTCHNFYALGRDYLLDDDRLTEFQHSQQVTVMGEDTDALEAQELMLVDDRHAPRESSIRSDLAALRGRRLLQRMATRETAAREGTPVGATSR